MQKTKLFLAITSALILVGCVYAETTIVELPPLEAPDDDHDYDHD